MQPAPLAVVAWLMEPALLLLQAVYTAHAAGTVTGGVCVVVWAPRVPFDSSNDLMLLFGDPVVHSSQTLLW